MPLTHKTINTPVKVTRSIQPDGKSKNENEQGLGMETKPGDTTEIERQSGNPLQVRVSTKLWQIELSAFP